MPAWQGRHPEGGSLLLALALGLGSLASLLIVVLRPHVDGWTVADALSGVRLALWELRLLRGPGDGAVQGALTLAFRELRQRRGT